MSKAIPRSKIIGMQVYTPSARLVGTIKDFGLIPGESRVSLIVETVWGKSIEIDWTDVSAVGDIVLLKTDMEIPEVPAKRTPTPEERKICPTCGKPATWIEQYKRWYCYNCRKYL